MLSIPAIYDVLAVGYFWGILVLVNWVHGYFMVMSFIPVESLHLLCVVRIEMNLNYLARKLRGCTGFSEKTLNEEELTECVKYHCEILE